MKERSCENCEHFCCKVGSASFVCNKISTAGPPNTRAMFDAVILPTICRHYNELETAFQKVAKKFLLAYFTECDESDSWEELVYKKPYFVKDLGTFYNATLDLSKTAVAPLHTHTKVLIEALKEPTP